VGVADPFVLFDNLLEDEARAEVDGTGFVALDWHVCFFSDARNA